MNQKTKNSVLILIGFLIIVFSSLIYLYFFQNEKYVKTERELKELRASFSSLETLLDQLRIAEERVAKVDSVLELRKFIIPSKLAQESFYEFVDDNFSDSPVHKFINVDFKGEFNEDMVKYYLYNITGVGYYESVYRLVYAIEQSKELKKIEKGELVGNTTVSKKGNPRYLVKFDFDVKTYFAENDQFSSTNYEENILSPKELYDAYYPLIQNKIQANNSDLPDIQDAELLFLYPDGAFIKDAQGNTFLLKEGDKVYLGYTTSINQREKSVSFILNKGGIVEYYTLSVNNNLRNKK